MVTGAARRIGATIATRLHKEHWRVLVHCRLSGDSARSLVAGFNAERPGSAAVLEADLLDPLAVTGLATQALGVFGRLDLLVNNASSFFPSPLGQIDQATWDELMGTNLKVPLFLTQACLPYLRDSGGAVVNLTDVHAARPLGQHAVYEAAKAGLLMLTRSLARDLAPAVRVNAVAPGNILWSEDHPYDPAVKAALLQRVPMGRLGTADEVAAAVCYLAGSSYITGQVLTVDGGYLLT